MVYIRFLERCGGWVTVEPHRRGKETRVPSSAAMCVSWREERDGVRFVADGAGWSAAKNEKEMSW